MKILVINGSPKGKYSITLQTVLYIQKHFPEDSFDVLHIGQQIKSWEKDFSAIVPKIEESDLLLFAYPVYTFLAPYQLHRFIELLKEYKVDVSGKMAAQISTSKHFYDITAHQYIKDNCADLGLLYLYGLSADMDDLLNETGQKQALDFWKYVQFCATNKLYESIDKIHAEFLPYHRSFQSVPKRQGFDTVIITNALHDESLENLIDDFRDVYPLPVRIVNIAKFPFKGGCLGCFRCASKGDCIYNDGFQELLREDILKADAIVYAFTIKDHSMGASFKIYDDRQFCNGHRQLTVGMPVGYLVHGNVGAETNLQTLLHSRSEVAQNFLCGVVYSQNAQEQLPALSSKLVYALEHKMHMPNNFYGVGGTKIFRDLIYTMRGLMKADHKFYKKTGVYDFPQKRKMELLKMWMLGSFVSIPAVQKKMGNKMNEGMIAPYQKVIRIK